MEEYFEHFELFHQHRLSSMTQKKKFIQCKNCDSIKKFIINDNELIYSCGSKKGTCGEQFKINIPDYIHYQKIKDAYQQTLNGSFTFYKDIHDFSEYNVDALSKYLPISNEKNEIDEIKDTILRDMDDLMSRRFVIRREMNLPLSLGYIKDKIQLNKEKE